MSSGENCTFPAGLRGTSSQSSWPADPAPSHSFGSSIDLARICVPLIARICVPLSLTNSKSPGLLILSIRVYVSNWRALQRETSWPDS